MLYVLLPAIVLLLCLGCSDDSSPTDGDQPNAPAQVSLPLENALSDIQLPANQPTSIQLTLQLPPDLGMVESAEIDIAATMQHVTASFSEETSKLAALLSLISSQASAQATVRVGSDPITVCEQSVSYGPYSITSTSLDDPAPDNIALDNATVQILNAGALQLCMEIVSTVDVTFSLDQVEANVTRGDCGAPTNFAGVWAGTYECGNSCTGEPFGDTVQITVTQDGTTASYTDLLDDTYTGTVCGDLLRFEYVGTSFIERGTLTLLDANHAIKRSTWRYTTAPYCSGNCVDSLTRVDGT